MKRYACLFVLISMIVAPALAYRPFGTEDAGVAGQGIIQFEGSWDYLRWSDGKIERNLLWVPIYGLTDNLEVSAEIPYLFHANTDGTSPNGVGDINLVVKDLMAVEGEWRPALAVKGVVKLDNGDFGQGLGSGDKDYSLYVVASKTFGRSIVHSHLGYSWIGKNSNANLRDIPLFALGLDCGLTDRLRLIAEINGNRHPDSTQAEDPRSALLGFTYKISEKLIFDLAGKWGLSAASPAWDAAFGFSVTL